MMRSVVAALWLAGWAAATSHATFDEFVAAYNRSYPSAAVAAQRRRCYAESLAAIDRLNAAAGGGAPVYGVNAFADLCADEFRAAYLAPVKQRPPIPAATFNRTYSPGELRRAEQTPVDWRTRGLVTPVKDQGVCGSCWAFSSVAALEAVHRAQTGQLVSLSEEELVQCAGAGSCNGGMPLEALAWVVRNGGITSEGDYPYTSGNGATGACRTNLLPHHVASIGQVIALPQNEPQTLAWMAEYRPVGVCLDALNWQYYQGGVMNNCVNTGQTDHCVTIVGFGVSPVPYWLIKNSWGVGWGEGGYLRLAYGSRQCSICDYPAFSGW